MFILAATTSSLEVLLGGVITTSQLPFVTSYADLTTTTFTAGSLTGATNSTTAVTIAAAPAASTQRQVKSINVYNADTVSTTVTIRYNDNATTRILVKAVLATGESLVYTQDAGWQVIQANGAIKTGTAAALTTKGDLLVFDTGTTRLAVGTNGQALVADSASAPGVKWFTLQDGDSIQLNGTSHYEVRKLRDVAGDPVSPVAGEVWYNTTSKNPRVHDDAIANANIVRSLYALTTATATIGTSDNTEVTFDSNAQFSFPANTLVTGQVYRLRVTGRTTGAGGTSTTMKLYFGTASVTILTAIAPQVAAGFLDFLLRVTAAGGTAQVHVNSEGRWHNSAVQIASDLGATFDNTIASVLSLTHQYTISSGAAGVLIDGFTLERIN
jgi:hypothetical protein